MQVTSRKSATKPRQWGISRPAEPGIDVGVRENIAANLRRLLREKGLKQREFGARVGVSEQVVSQWVNGRACPEYRQLDIVAVVLDASYEDLVRDPSADIVKITVPQNDVDAILRELAATRGYELRPKRKS